MSLDSPFVETKWLQDEAEKNPRNAFSELFSELFTKLRNFEFSELAFRIDSRYLSHFGAI